MDDATYPAHPDELNMALRRRLIERIGGFDRASAPAASAAPARMPISSCGRNRAGCRVVYLPQVVVFHDHKRTTSPRAMR